MLEYRMQDDQGGPQPPKPWTEPKKPEDEKKQDEPKKEQ